MQTRLNQVVLACHDCGQLLEPHHLACPRCQLILPEESTRMIEPARRLIVDKYETMVEIERCEIIGVDPSGIPREHLSILSGK